MDSCQECLESEILQTGKCLQELLKKNLYPDFVRDGDMILMMSPWEETDYRVGIYLYDIQDYSMMSTYEVPVSDEQRRFPPKAVELSFMLFCNENHHFGGTQREQIYLMLNEIVRTVYDNPVVRREDGENIQLVFLRENVEFKIRLWGSFNKALQPAVYIKTVPVLIASRRKRRISRVQERNYDVEKK